VGKWETCFWFSTFPSAVVVGAAGNVGISPPFGEISKGLVERVGSRFLAFHAFHRPGISTALFFAPKGRRLPIPAKCLEKGVQHQPGPGDRLWGFLARYFICRVLNDASVFFPFAVFEPIAFPVHLEDVDMVRQTVQ
jgi:hypothetical protein